MICVVSFTTSYIIHTYTCATTVQLVSNDKGETNDKTKLEN